MLCEETCELTHCDTLAKPEGAISFLLPFLVVPYADTVREISVSRHWVDVEV